MSPDLTFQVRINILGINPYVLVTASQADTLQPNWRKPLPVMVQVNGKPDIPWHINMMPAGNGDFYLYLHNDVRKASGTKVGDKVKVSIWFDVTYRNGPMHPMPSQLKEALAQNDDAAKHWQTLPPSTQKEVLRYLAGLQSEAALERNVQRAIQALSGTGERFLGRNW